MSLDLNSDYKLVRSKDFRNNVRPDYIIINHSLDFLRPFEITMPELIFDDRKSKQPKFIKVARNNYGYDTDFSHFYIELVHKNYLRISSLGQRYQSPFIEELCDKKILHRMYSNSILITIIGNYNVDGGDIVPKEVYNHLGYLIADLRRMTTISFSKVKLLNDIFNKEENDKLGLKKFSISETRLDLSTVRMYTQKF